MSPLAAIARNALRAAGHLACEVTWPTRCCVCERAGCALCASCEGSLPYLDRWTACPTCGAAFGAVQCTECCPQRLAALGREALPFAGCASAVRFDARTGRIVRVYKDLGEQRLALDMARLMARAAPPEWRADAIAFVPASREALTRRGFDHAELLACALSSLMKLPVCAALDRPRAHDQRKLGRAARVSNLASALRAHPSACQGRSLLLADDVMTTGSTLCAAADTLLEAGAGTVRALTFARV
ncbi:ComF family protein [Eggerthellaceae bacterium zg-997]|nr:ComF family protein [Eggerthellaceae bacterium zg-997]